jgi:thiamine transport system substrate-binding protein
MSTSIRLFVLLLLLLPLNVGAQDIPRVTLVAHDSFNYTQAVMDAFSAETGITVEVLRIGDTGLLVNQAILTRDNPLGDVLFGIDNTFLGRALAADLFIPYESPLLEQVDPGFQLDDQHRVTPIDYGDVCLNYEIAYFEENRLAAPSTLADLTNPDYAGLLAVQNPATSSPGLAFLLATIAVFGEEGDYTWLDYWTDLVANDVLISNDWSDAYYNQFSGSAGSVGVRPLVVSYASSPPAEVIFAEPPTDVAPTAAIVADDTCFRQIEFAGILQGTAQEAEAQQLIDFLLSTDFQEDMPLNMFVFPVNSEAELPEAFATYAAVPEKPVLMTPQEIDDNRERWIEEWTESVLR